jgi:signal transduction histidine kinase
VDELLNTLPCGVVSFTDAGVVTFANATLANLLGYPPGVLAGERFESLLTVPGRIFFQTHLFPMLKLHGKASEIFLLFRSNAGADVGALVNVVRRERDGAFVNDCALIEVRERRKYEDELLSARRVAESATAALAVRTREAEAANALLQQQKFELEQQQQQLEEQSEELRTSNEQLRVRSEELERARAIADEANHAKTQFLTTMSHELRTPLNAIGGYVQLIELGIHGPVTDAQRGALDRVNRSQRHLLRLINDILNTARIEAGRVEYLLEDVPVAEVIASVTPMVDPQMATAGLTLESSVPQDVVARADREKVRQVLINLLTNAMKFTLRGGRVEISAGYDDSGSKVCVRVADSGIGIPAANLKTIFEPFVQVEVERSLRREGTGLGLAISRDLARAMGGDLTVESEPGVGSTFIFELPRA